MNVTAAHHGSCKKKNAFAQRALQESSIIINRLQTNIMLQPTRQKKNQSVTSEVQSETYYESAFKMSAMHNQARAKRSILY